MAKVDQTLEACMKLHCGFPASEAFGPISWKPLPLLGFFHSMRLTPEFAAAGKRHFRAVPGVGPVSALLPGMRMDVLFLWVGWLTEMVRYQLQAIGKRSSARGNYVQGPRASSDNMLSDRL